MSHATAILLFSRTAGEEALHKPFSHRGKAVNGRIAGHFIAHAGDTARRSGLPVVHVSSAQQRGETFGERLANAFRLVFAQGYARVLAIGNDCPYLTPGLLREAAARLQTQPVVLGPARDGGAYLIGLSAGSFRVEAFCGLAWQTPACYASLRTYCHTHGLACAELPPHYDLDNRRDVARFLRAHHRGEPLRHLARCLVSLLREKEVPLPAAAPTSTGRSPAPPFPGAAPRGLPPDPHRQLPKSSVIPYGTSSLASFARLCLNPFFVYFTQRPQRRSAKDAKKIAFQCYPFTYSISLCNAFYSSY
jgi:glycosyltransferase A (GT-A) superfamily protein (DUF2064 family)